MVYSDGVDLTVAAPCGMVEFRRRGLGFGLLVGLLA